MRLDRRTIVAGAAAGIAGAALTEAASGAPPSRANRSTAQGTTAATAILVDSFLPAQSSNPPTPAQDTAAIQGAIAQAATSGGVVVFGARTYTLAATIELPSGTSLLGTSIGARSINAPGPGTIITRVPNGGVMFQVIGMPASGNTQVALVRSITIDSIFFNGADSAADLMQFSYAQYIVITRCAFTNTLGRHLALTTVFDSRINDTDFVSGGSAATQTPMIEISTSAQDAQTANNIYFTGCRHETFPYIALMVTGSNLNTNNIFLTDCKYESTSNAEFIHIENTAGVYFNAVLLFLQSGTARALLYFSRTRGIIGDLSLGAARNSGLTNYLLFDAGCGAGELKIFVNDLSNGTTAPNTPVLEEVVNFVGGAPPPVYENGNFLAVAIYGHNFNATPPFSTLWIAPG
jgi:hypothetical protein